ncbi:hypothetical protein VTO73DRAFT_1787 [Trametes versicolor]
MKRAADMDHADSPLDESPSPSPSSHTSELSGPPRKRARSDVTPEERREARAHRNRIAAQNSRDRRKAQFSYLEQRVSELEEENRQLRAGMGLTAPPHHSHEQKDEEREKDRARERENEELRQRVKTLEAGWEAVMKALAASGLPLDLAAVPPPSSSSNPSAPVTLGQPSTSTLPVFVPPTPISPAPSTTSSSSTLFDSDDFDSTRHLARLELNIPHTSSYPPIINIGEAAPTTADEVAMDDLFREILATSPVTPQAPLPPVSAALTPRSPAQSVSEIKLSPAPSASAPAASMMPALPEIDWESEVEMQRLLAMLPMVQQDATLSDAGATAGDFPSALDLELSGWDLSGALSVPASSSSVSVF